MNTPRQAARQRRRRQQRLMVGAVALAVAGVLAGLVIAFLPDGEAEAGPSAAVDSVASAPVTATTASGSSSPTPKHTPKPKGTPTPKADKTTAAPRPSATKAPPTTAQGAASAGRIRPDTTYEGVATHYDAGNGDGACLLGPSDDLMIAAMNTTDYETSKACGAHVLVRAANGRSVTVRITNECPLPCAPGQLDLSKEAFAKLADLDAGRIPVTWSLLSPSTSDTISIRYKTGSSPYWCGIQAIGHRNPVARLEVGTASGWRQLPRTEYNYFLSENGSGCGGAIRITDIYGERLTINGITVRPDVAQPTRVQFAQH
ncbi:expansin EXLX1 family cellulose-binding protein [Streptomyces sp. P17]|nr:expansin EXLX1 family cellulose-binding protein [Streptomyces sp. P17]MDT9701750.1 expansin EXLX1 family cellulose-binding protein [Streptomyces sp. P17]